MHWWTRKKIKCQVQSFPTIVFLPLNKSYRAESQYFTFFFFSLDIYFDQTDDHRTVNITNKQQCFQTDVFQNTI